MGKIVFHRNKAESCSMSRMEIMLDSRLLGYINSAETIEFKIESGSHILEIKHWPFLRSSKFQFQISSDEIIEFELTFRLLSDEEYKKIQVISELRPISYYHNLIDLVVTLPIVVFCLLSTHIKHCCNIKQPPIVISRVE